MKVLCVSVLLQVWRDVYERDSLYVLLVMFVCSCDVKDHTVGWSELFEFHCKMYGSPVTGELEPCCCKVSVRKVRSCRWRSLQWVIFMASSVLICEAILS